MRLLFKNYKSGEVKVQVTNPDDLWCLSQIIEPGDMVIGRSYRKVKLSSAESKESVVKKPVFLSIKVEKVEFHPYATQIRVMGVVAEGVEDVPAGSHHTIEIEEGTIVKIVKKQWYRYMIDRLEESANEKYANVLIVVLDRNEAGFALLKQYGFEWLSEFEGDMCKKGFDEKKESKFYLEIVKLIESYAERYKVENIVIASPAFWKDEVMKVLRKANPSLAKIAVLATCNVAGREGVNEVLKRDEVKTVLRQQRVAKEIKAVE